MSPRRLAVAAGATIVVGLSACGGGGEEKATLGAPTPGPAAARSVTAQIDGRALNGHCRGERRDAPAVLLDSGVGRQDELTGIEELLAEQTLVCAYDRAGVARSDAPGKTPRPMSELVADLDAFAAAAHVPEPYVLVGHSTGGNVVFAYAQAHPEKVAGFLAMNPLPPSETFMPAVKKVVTAHQYAGEKAFSRGENDQHISFAEPVLGNPIPPSVRYVIMFDLDCGGNEYCERVSPAVTRSVRALARVGQGGRFEPVKGAGFNIYSSRPELVLATVQKLLMG
jgi:hypothetical protein